MQKFTTISDVGGVLAGNKNFGVLLQNGGGDGETYIAILRQKDRNLIPSEARFNTMVKGTINIYNHDCAQRTKENIITTIRGAYLVYYLNNYIYFLDINA